MAIYVQFLIAGIFITGATAINWENKVHFSQSIAVLATMALILLVGLRGLTGTDTLAYFIHFSQGYMPGEVESGFRVLSGVFSNLFGNFAFFEIFVATLSFGLILFVGLKTTENPMLLIFSLYLSGYALNAMNIMRQVFAGGIWILAFYYRIKCSENKGWKDFFAYLILVILAASIHKSVIIIFLLFELTMFLRKTLFSKTSTKLILSVSIFLYGVLNYEGLLLNAFITLLSKLPVVKNYVGYLNGFVQSTSSSSSPTMLAIYLLLFFVFSLILFNPKEDDLPSQLFLVGSFDWLLIYGSGTSWMADRLGLFFLPIFLILIVRTTDGRKLTWRNLLIAFLSIVAMILMFVRIIYGNFGQIIPYTPFFGG